MIRLDEHSDFLPAKDYKQAQMETQGKPVLELGLGFERKKGRIKVLECVEQSPAFKVGIIPGDEVLAVNGKPTAKLTVQEIYSLLHSYGDDKVALTIKREPLSNLLVVSVTPDVVTRQNVQHGLLDGHYAYFRILRFGENTVTDFDKALRQEENASNKTIEGIVVDLRNNPGGLLPRYWI